MKYLDKMLTFMVTLTLIITAYIAVTISKQSEDFDARISENNIELLELIDNTYYVEID